MLHKHDWVRAEGRIVEVHVRPGHTAPEKYVVEVTRSDGSALRAEVPQPHEKHFPVHVTGDVTGFLVDARSGAVEFDLSDQRNAAPHGFAALLGGMPGQSTGMRHGGFGGLGGIAGMMEMAVSGIAEAQAAMSDLAHVGPGPSVPQSGPPWVVPDQCPNCGARVDQAAASHDASPHCAYCNTPLPVQAAAATGGLVPARARILADEGYSIANNSNDFALQYQKYIVEVHPDSEPAFRTEVQAWVSFADRPGEGDEVRALYKPGSHDAQLDLKGDPRFDWELRKADETAAAAARREQLLNGPLPADSSG
jgi:hypothetical protein